MNGPTSLQKAWLMLGALVLATHLILLQGVPLALNNVTSAPTPLTFTVHRLTAQPDTSVTPVKWQTNEDRVPPPRTPTKPVASARRQNPAKATATDDSQPTAQVQPPENPGTKAMPANAPVAASGPENQSPKGPVQQFNAKVSADSLPGSVRLLYKVKTNKFPYKLDAELLWTQQEGHYSANFRVGVLGQYRVQTSRGTVTAAGLLPERFSDKYRSEVAAHFNWPLSKVTFSANTPDVPLQEGAQDRMSVLIQLAAMLAGSPAQRAPGTTITVQTIGPRDADSWIFTVGEAENLVVPSDPENTVRAIKMTRKPRQLYDQTMELWMAPVLNYLPARIRLTEANGDYVDQMWFATPADKP